MSDLLPDISTLVAPGKAAFVVIFGLSLAAVLTWVDRRGGAMFQDRVGPERAVFFLPARLMQALVAVPAVFIAGGVVAYCFIVKPENDAARDLRALVFGHLAIFMVWFTGVAIAGWVKRKGVRNSVDNFMRTYFPDPRVIFYYGLGAHLIAWIAILVVHGNPAGKALTEIGAGAGPAVFAFAALLGALYVVKTMDGREKVGLRLGGLLHPMADGIKSAFKEDFIPLRADRFLHMIAPLITMFPVLVLMAIVPFGDTLCFETKPDGALDLLKLAPSVPADGVCQVGSVPLQVLDINVGLLFFFALAGTGVVGAAIAGWSSDNKFSLLGGLRAASQMVSYEVTLGATLIGALMVFGTVQLDSMVSWQAENAWGIFVQPVAFVLFFAAAVAETKRTPFDLPEGESELVGGYFTEYSGMKFAMFFFSEYIAVVASAAVMATMFFGGWHLPFLERDGIHLVVGDSTWLYQPLSHGAVIALGVMAFMGKLLALCWLQIAIRWTLPRFRYDQLMRLCWRMLLPASLVNVLATGLIVLGLQSGGAETQDVLRAIGDVTEIVVAAVGLVVAVIAVRFVVQPANKRQLVASSTARLVSLVGRTKVGRMGA